MTESPSSSPRMQHAYHGGMRAGYSPPCSPSSRPIFASSSASSGSGSGPLPIRGSAMEVAPPPIPPPRHVSVIPGREPSWSRGAPKGSGTIVGGSSLLGGWERRSVENAPFLRHPVPRKPDLAPMPRSPLQKSNSTAVKKEGTGGLPSIALITNFPGERPLEARNHKNSTAEYDKQLLSKLGRPKTPPRANPFGSVENSPLSAGRPLRLDTQPALHRLTLADRSLGSNPDSPFKASSPFSARWAQLHQQGTVSPSLLSSTSSSRNLSLQELRTPTYEHSTAPSSLAAEHASFSRINSVDRGSNASLSLLSSAFDETERERDRTHHVMRGSDWGSFSRSAGSYDQGIFGGEVELDAEFTAHAAGPAAGNLRSLHADAPEYPQPFSLDGSLHDMHQNAQQGVKRKASPVLGEKAVDEPQPQAARSRTPGRLAKRASPAYQPATLHASYASHSSISHTNSSYGSSATLSTVPSSTSSLASQGHLSPNSIASTVPDSKGSQYAQPMYGKPNLLETSSRSEQAQNQFQLAPQAQTKDDSQQEIGPGRNEQDNGSASVRLLANIHMCDCCPKKPKKFSTTEELELHKREKQHTCPFCGNKFKNKNERERHQNSLHVRRQSWSCAVLENHYERAFHPCTAAVPGTGPQQVSSNVHPEAEYDNCGYCGKQFPNLPAPDWVERSRHLTEVHKFGECNQSKKFFRADHFRQHLKHSHGGQPGKWTNMLEQACVREEMPPQPGEPQAPQQPQLQASQALKVVQQQQQSQPNAHMTPYQIDLLRSAPSVAPNSVTTSPSGPTRPGQYNTYGSHVPYEKIIEEDEAHS